MKPSCRARTSELLQKVSECFESLSMNGKMLKRCRRTPTEFSAALLEKVLCGRIPERVRGSVFTEWHENYLRRLKSAFSACADSSHI